MEHSKEIKKCNELLGRELGRNPHGDPLYKWEHGSNLVHYRHTGDNMQKVGNLYLPRPSYVPVPAYPHLNDRWMLAFWTFLPEDEWLAAFGNKMLWSKQGNYYPTNAICKVGKVPNYDYTQELIAKIQLQRNTPVSKYEEEWANEEERRDRAVFNTIHDVISDSLTAYGNDPGKRSGGVSFPAPEKSSGENLVTIN
jgi:hypothetical protein